ncbi:MAG: ATP-binding protein [Phycisphaerae bacterium]
MGAQDMLNLSDIVGQDEAVGRLRRVLAGERMPHAYLFAGPDGVGRRTTATALAAALLCDNPGGGSLLDAGEPDACGQCASCRLMAADTHPDFHPVYKELAGYHEDPQVRSRKMQELGIPVIRSFLISPAHQAASRGRGKVFVVLEAELMSQAAQNALLKTLEEPPAGVTIILITDRPELLLATTRSRCATVRFGPLPREFVRRKLSENGTDDAEADFLAAYTDGSIGRALQLAEEGIFELKREMVSAVAKLGAGGDANLAAKLAQEMEKRADKRIRQERSADTPELARTLAQRRIAGEMLRVLGAAFRDALTVATGAGREPVNIDQIDAVNALAERFEHEQLADIIEQLSEYERLIWRNVNAKIIWDNVVITCASAARLGV